MNERIRSTRSGILGLDLGLGGGFRLVRRTWNADRESATILVRGGPGAGKSVLAQDLAVRLARSLGGDALYACVEILPSEVLAQRIGFAGFDPTAVVELSEAHQRTSNSPTTSLLLGMLDIPSGPDGQPELGGTLLMLSSIASGRGYKPKVVVVDSLSDGYGLGASTPRVAADAVCKLAIEQGWILILIEEADANVAFSPWAFAVDTVLNLRVQFPPAGGIARRELIISKHRFAGADPGPHRLWIDADGIRVIPPLSTYGNMRRHLALPPPACHRSIRPWLSASDDVPAPIDVQDGVGLCARAVGIHASHWVDMIGRWSGRGTSAEGERIRCWVGEAQRAPSPTDGEVVLTGAEPLSDGEAWVEAVVNRLQTLSAPVSRVLIGPVGREAAAVSALASLLRARGLLVVVYGDETLELRAGLADVSIRQGAEGSFVFDFGSASYALSPQTSHFDLD